MIPTICWGDEYSFDWCFDGEPVLGDVAVSSVGTQRHPVARYRFQKGYEEMMKRLQPTKVVFFGMIPDTCTGNIEAHDAYYTTLTHNQAWLAKKLSCKDAPEVV